RLGLLTDSDEPDQFSYALAAPEKPPVAAAVDHPAAPPKMAPAGKQTGGKDHIAPVTAAEFAARPTDAETVEPSAEPMRLPDDPGIEPDDVEGGEKAQNRFRLF